MKLLTNGALLCCGLSLVGHVSKAAVGSFYMVLPAFNEPKGAPCFQQYRNLTFFPISVLLSCSSFSLAALIWISLCSSRRR